MTGYRQFEYIHSELPDILAATDLVITRGGSNAIFEFLALKIPMLIIPLSLQQSRGDQILNAKSFVEKGYALMLEEEQLNSNSLLNHLADLNKNRQTYQLKMDNAINGNTINRILNEIYKS